MREADLEPHLELVESVADVEASLKRFLCSTDATIAIFAANNLTALHMGGGPDPWPPNSRRGCNLQL